MKSIKYVKWLGVQWMLAVFLHFNLNYCKWLPCFLYLGWLLHCKFPSKGISNHLSYKCRNDQNIYKKWTEICWYWNCQPKKSNTVGVIYRHPSMDLTNFNCSYLNKQLKNGGLVFSNAKYLLMLIRQFNSKKCSSWGTFSVFLGWDFLNFIAFQYQFQAI